MGNKPYGIRIRSGAEIEQQARLKKREELLERLNSASEKRKKKPVEPKPKEPEIRRFGQSYDADDEYQDFLRREENTNLFRGGKVDEYQWDQFMDQMETESIDAMNDSPLDNATSENIMGFWEPDIDEDPYAEMFKDEIAMTSEVLKELKESGKWVSQRLKSMTGKGAGGGAPKSFSDLVSAFSSLQSTKLSAIDKIAGWKLKREELRLKAKKENPEEGQGIDEMVDQYYSRFLSGDRREYIANALASADPNYDGEGMPSDYADDGSDVNYGGFNITDPGSYNGDVDDVNVDDADPYGYIRNEGRDVEVCVQRFPSGRMAFVALDAEGESVDDYELPDPSYINSLNIRPTSRYATDMTGRRYRIIDFDPNEDISDV